MFDNNDCAQADERLNEKMKNSNRAVIVDSYDVKQYN